MRNWGLICGAFVALLLGCEVLTARTGVQCRSDEECHELGVDFLGARCSNEGVCERIVLPEGGASLALDGCSTSEECTVRLGNPARCVGAVCIPMISEGANCRIIGDAQGEDVLLVGGLLPFGGANALEYPTGLREATQVVTYWNQHAPLGAARRVGAILCDEGEERALEGILKLRPSFVFGPYTNAVARGMLASHPEVVAFAPAVDDMLLSQVDASRKLSSCAPNASLAVKPMQSAIALLRASLEVDLGRPAKLALVATTSADGVAFADAVQSGLVLNGEPANVSAHFRRFDLVFDMRVGGIDPSIVGVADSVAREVPDLIVVADRALAGVFYTALEGRWPARAQNQPFPSWLVYGAPVNLASQVKVFKRKGAFFSVGWSRNQGQQANLSSLLGGAFELDPAANRSIGLANDCLFAGLYSSLAGATSRGVNMSALSQDAVFAGIPLATGGSAQNQLRLVQADIAKGFGLLAQSPVVNTVLLGTTVDIGFLPTRTVAGIPGLYCLSSPSSSQPYTWAESGVSFDANGEASGNVACN